MRSKFTLTIILFWLLFPIVGYAQTDDTIRTLIISEIRGGWQRPYIELCNIGDAPVNLSEFEIAKNNVLEFKDDERQSIMLPDFVLQPDSTYLISYVFDYYDEYGPASSGTWTDLKDKIDFPVFNDEDLNGPQDGKDSISIYTTLLGLGGNGVYIAHHVGEDSTIVDVVFIPSSLRDIAGIADAWDNYILVRSTSVTQGNTDWNNSRGNSLQDSEWQPIPYRTTTFGYDNPVFTTVKHHGNADLSDDFVTSSTINIDWDNNVMEIPWGVYTNKVINSFDLSGGIGWHYHKLADSTSNIVVSGDTLTLYAVGDALEQIDFEIIQSDAPTDLALVFPKNKKMEAGWWNQLYYVTEDQPQIDTVGGIPYNTRVDTLYKYVEKAPNSEWEIIWEGGTERADLRWGDILRVTAEDGFTQKDYFLAVDTLVAKSHNALLSAITWPDAPSFLRESPAWQDDTIPGFQSNNYSYQVTIPYGTTTVPALVPIPENLNANIQIERASTIRGKVEDRITKITVTAEDDSTMNVYSVLFSEEKPAELIQDFETDPIFTQFSVNSGKTKFLEISNPGNKSIDLSNYLIASGNNATSLLDVIQEGTDVFNGRYKNYVPGYVFQSEDEWNVNPAIIEKDLGVDPILQGGESFAIGYVAKWYTDLPAYQLDALDVIIDDGNADIPSLEAVVDCKIIVSDGTVLSRYNNKTTTIALFKIVGDSIKSGEKGLGDPADLELVDIMGDFVSDEWMPVGVALPGKFLVQRKSEFWEGDTQPGLLGSWGDTEETSEWTVRDDQYFDVLGYSDPIFMVSSNIGFHSFDPVTVNSSTISSFVYKVSDGYTSPQTIEGVTSGTTVAEMLANIDKANEEQTLEVIGKAENDELVADDTLKVISADASNITKYVISIGSLSDDAVLVARDGSGYTITHETSTGEISGISFGATIEEVLDNVDIPEFASLNVIDEDDELIPMQVRDFNNEYSATHASGYVFFEVIAEDGVTRITYQLQTDVEDNEAYVYSDVYSVDQTLRLVGLIPQGTNVQTLFNFLRPNLGASIKLVDKVGYERTKGAVAFDDKVVVTSADGSTESVYFLNFLEHSATTQAYVISDTYSVNQLTHTISEIPNGTLLDEFLGLIVPATGATITVLDQDGNVVEDGALADGYQLKVVSGDQTIEVVYQLAVLVSVNNPAIYEISVYPNPVTDQLFVAGLRKDSKIVIYNMSGKLEKMIESSSTEHAKISVSNLSAGMYILYIQNENYRSVPVKFIKKE